jgi:antitoxin component YwqK of YwqJK toxin-antitoxin module
MTEQLIEYHDNGLVKSKGFLHDGQYVGKYETWYRTGIKCHEIYYDNSPYNNIGEYKWWNISGELIIYQYFYRLNYRLNVKNFTINVKCVFLKLKKKLLRKVRLKKNNKLYTPLLSDILIKDLISICISYI